MKQNSEGRSNEIVPVTGSREVQVTRNEVNEFVTFFIGKQMFGVSVFRVQDILHPENIARIPLAPKEIAGVINLRGRIVTVIDVRARLGLPPLPSENGGTSMAVTVEDGPDLYSLLVDRVGDVISLPVDRFEQNPSTLDKVWRTYSEGIYRLDGQLMVVLNVDGFLNIGPGDGLRRTG
ncbi:chemotaxis protein CheW [Magnetospira thiophila]